MGSLLPDYVLARETCHAASLLAVRIRGYPLALTQNHDLARVLMMC